MVMAGGLLHCMGVPPVVLVFAGAVAVAAGVVAEGDGVVVVGLWLVVGAAVVDGLVVWVLALLVLGLLLQAARLSTSAKNSPINIPFVFTCPPSRPPGSANVDD